MYDDLVSIIIPCFNSEKYLNETLKSVFSQTYKNYEIIIIDDCSTDNTRSIINLYADKLKVEFLTKNMGVSHARNIGTKLSKGKFIQYLDADDVLTPCSIENKLNILTKLNADVAYSQYQILVKQDDGTFKPGKISPKRNKNMDLNPEIAVFFDFWTPPAALMFTRKIVEKIGMWNELLTLTQDSRFCLDAARNNGKFVFVESISAYYRIHNESISRRNRVNFTDSQLLYIKQVHQLWESEGKFKDLQYKSALLRAYGHVGRECFEVNKKTFEEIYTAIKKLEPNYVPQFPKSLYFLSKILGYKNALFIAILRKNLLTKIAECSKCIKSTYRTKLNSKINKIDFINIFPFYGEYLKTGGMLRKLVTKIVPFHAWHLFRGELSIALLRYKNKNVPSHFKGQKDLLVNIAPGTNFKQGWVNIDVRKYEGVDYLYDCRKKLPFTDKSVQAIYTEHFFEHIDYTEEIPFFLTECYRVLKADGIIRIIVPDATKLIRAYLSKGWEEFYKLERVDMNNRDLFLNCTYNTKMELINNVFRQGNEHKFAYDFETLEFLLYKYGFKKVIKQEYDKSLFEYLCIDSFSRKGESLYVEAIK